MNSKKYFEKRRGRRTLRAGRSALHSLSFEILENRCLLDGGLNEAIDLALMKIDHGLCKKPLSTVVVQVVSVSPMTGASLDMDTGMGMDDMSMSMDDMGMGMDDMGMSMDDMGMGMDGMGMDGMGMDGMGMGVANAHVLLSGRDHADQPVAMLGSTNHDGFYRFERLHTGFYSVTRIVRDSRDRWQAIDRTDEIYLMPGDVISDIRFEERKVDSEAAAENDPMSSILEDEPLTFGSKAAADLVTRPALAPLGAPLAAIALRIPGSMPAAFVDAVDSFFREAGEDRPPEEETQDLGKSAQVSGRVFQDLDADSTLDHHESGMVGETVVLKGQDEAGQPVLRETRTDARGYYEIANLPPGDYQLIAPIGGPDGVMECQVTRRIILERGQAANVDLAIQLQPYDIALSERVPILTHWGWSRRALFWLSWSALAVAAALLRGNTDTTGTRCRSSRRRGLA